MSTEAVFKQVKYKRDMTVCVGKDEYDKFILCTIDEILIDDTNNNISFLGLRHNATYNQNFGIFESVESNRLEGSKGELAIF